MRLPDGVVGGASLRAVAPILDWVHGAVTLGGFYESGGGLQLRDATVALPIYALNQDDLQIRFTPGVSLPLGSATAGLRYTLLANGSVDPTLGAGFSKGSTWIGQADWMTRIPVYPGFDEIRQGVYTRASVRVARRVGDGAIYVGFSGAGQQTRGLTSPGFVELAPVAGGTFAFGEDWGLTINTRVPVYAGDQPLPYRIALMASLTYVLGKPAAAKH